MHPTSRHVSVKTDATLARRLAFHYIPRDGLGEEEVRLGGEGYNGGDNRLSNLLLSWKTNGGATAKEGLGGGGLLIGQKGIPATGQPTGAKGAAANDAIHSSPLDMTTTAIATTTTLNPMLTGRDNGVHVCRHCQYLYRTPNGRHYHTKSICDLLQNGRCVVGEGASGSVRVGVLLVDGGPVQWRDGLVTIDETDAALGEQHSEDDDDNNATNDDPKDPSAQTKQQHHHPSTCTQTKHHRHPCFPAITSHTTPPLVAVKLVSVPVNESRRLHMSLNEAKLLHQLCIPFGPQLTAMAMRREAVMVEGGLMMRGKGGGGVAQQQDDHQQFGKRRAPPQLLRPSNPALTIPYSCVSHTSTVVGGGSNGSHHTRTNGRSTRPPPHPLQLFSLQNTWDDGFHYHHLDNFCLDPSIPIPGVNPYTLAAIRAAVLSASNGGGSSIGSWLGGGGSGGNGHSSSGTNNGGYDNDGRRRSDGDQRRYSVTTTASLHAHSAASLPTDDCNPTTAQVPHGNLTACIAIVPTTATQLPAGMSMNGTHSNNNHQTPRSPRSGGDMMLSPMHQQHHHNYNNNNSFSFGGSFGNRPQQLYNNGNNSLSIGNNNHSNRYRNNNHHSNNNNSSNSLSIGGGGGGTNSSSHGPDPMAGCCPHRASFILEYCDGGTLQQYVERNGPTSPKRASAILFAVLLGLDHLHYVMHTIHRDIKPSNILLCREDSGVNARGPFVEAELWRVKLADFGIAKSDVDAKTVCGTRTYMAPEVRNMMIMAKVSDRPNFLRSRKLSIFTGNRGKYGLATDIFSLGVVLQFMLSGGVSLALGAKWVTSGSSSATSDSMSMNGNVSSSRMAGGSGFSALTSHFSQWQVPANLVCNCGRGGGYSSPTCNKKKGDEDEGEFRVFSVDDEDDSSDHDDDYDDEGDSHTNSSDEDERTPRRSRTSSASPSPSGAGQCPCCHRLTPATITLCNLMTHSDPSERPTLQQLFTHPFIVDHFATIGRVGLQRQLLWERFHFSPQSSICRNYLRPRMGGGDGHHHNASSQRRLLGFGNTTMANEMILSTAAVQQQQQRVGGSSGGRPPLPTTATTTARQQQQQQQRGAALTTDVMVSAIKTLSRAPRLSLSTLRCRVKRLERNHGKPTSFLAAAYGCGGSGSGDHHHNHNHGNNNHTIGSSASAQQHQHLSLDGTARATSYARQDTLMGLFKGCVFTPQPLAFLAETIPLSNTSTSKIREALPTKRNQQLNSGSSVPPSPSSVLDSDGGGRSPATTAARALKPPLSSANAEDPSSSPQKKLKRSSSKEATTKRSSSSAAEGDDKKKKSSSKRSASSAVGGDATSKSASKKDDEDASPAKKDRKRSSSAMSTSSFLLSIFGGSKEKEKVVAATSSSKKAAPDPTPPPPSPPPSSAVTKKEEPSATKTDKKAKKEKKNRG